MVWWHSDEIDADGDGSETCEGSSIWDGAPEKDAEYLDDEGNDFPEFEEET